MNTFLRTDEFDAWFKELKDQIGKARIIAWIISAESGNFADIEPVGGGVSEMRIHYGPGIGFISAAAGQHFTCCYAEVLNLPKKKDIKEAKRLAREWMEE